MGCVSALGTQIVMLPNKVCSEFDLSHRCKLIILPREDRKAILILTSTGSKPVLQLLKTRDLNPDLHISEETDNKDTVRVFGSLIHVLA